MNDLIEDSYCDWCNSYTTSTSLVMGYNGCWGVGECLCSKCLNKEIRSLYLVNHSGRQIFSSPDYYMKYWKNQSKIKVLRTPKDHQQQKHQEKEEQLLFLSAKKEEESSDEENIIMTMMMCAQEWLTWGILQHSSMYFEKLIYKFCKIDYYFSMDTTS